MLKQLYEKHLWEVRQNGTKNLLASHSTVEEFKWFDPKVYNRKNFPIPTPYGNLFDNSFHNIATIVGTPHGDFHSDYNYHRKWWLDEGGGGAGIDFSRPPSAPRSRSIYRCTAPTANWVGGHSNSLPILNDVKNRAQYALVNKLKRDLPEWDILTDFAELGETLGFCKETSKRLTDVVAGCLLRNPRRVLRGFMVDYTKKRGRHVKSVIDRSFRSNSDASVASLKAAGSLWLSYRYGLMPLIYSSQDAVKALAYSGKNETIYTEAQVTFSQKYTISDLTTETWDSAYTFWVKVRQYMTGQFSYRLKAKMSWSDSFRNRLRLHPVQIPSVAWELVPFSFVVDWFFSVSDWLTLLQINTLAQKIQITGTLKDLCIAGENIVGVRPTANDGLTAYTWTVLGKPPVSQTKTFIREANISLSLQPPSIENGLGNFKRQLDSFALAMNFVKSPSMRKIPS